MKIIICCNIIIVLIISCLIKTSINEKIVNLANFILIPAFLLVLFTQIYGHLLGNKIEYAYFIQVILFFFSLPFILFLAIITLFIKYYAIPENAYNIIVGLSLVIILNIWITKL